jgi:selenocysteine lyase/cysteine desulfurase
MLDCQKDLFEIPEGVTYLNASAMSPIPRAGRLAGEAGVAVKSHPWEMDRDLSGERSERARRAAARLIGATGDDIAIVGAASYGIAVAGRNLAPSAGSRILMVEKEHSSQSLEWERLAGERGAVLERVPRPGDGDWTSAILAAIERPGAPEVAIAALTPLHWTDGAIIDLERIASALRHHGAALVVDATQAAGILPIDVATLKPDFLVFPTYKWVLGPYSLAFLYAAPWRQDGEPVEQHGISRTEGGAFLAGARRYDIGERNNPITLPIAIAGMELIGEWGARRIGERLQMLTDMLADKATALGAITVERRLRAPHVLGLRFEGGITGRLVQRLAEQKVFVSLRGGDVMRVSPHVYNDAADVERFGEVLQAAIN